MRAVGDTDVLLPLIILCPAHVAITMWRDLKRTLFARADKSTFHDLSQMFEVYRKCPLEVQRKLHGYPGGWSDALEQDPQARIKIVSLFKKWVESNTVSSTHLSYRKGCSIGKREGL